MTGRTGTVNLAKRVCHHWIGAENRRCGNSKNIRQYIGGHRCPRHTPAALTGTPEPQPGPGIPAYRQAPQQSRDTG